MMTEQEFWAILAAMPQPKPVCYRLYYDELGRPIHYTMEDLPGNYIEIDQETYTRADPWVRVVNGAIKHISRWTSEKLVPTPGSGTGCHPCNVAIVDAQSSTTWSKQICGYEN